jgi:predicted Zn-dependent protease
MSFRNTFALTLCLLCLPVLASGQESTPDTGAVVEQALAEAQQGRVQEAIAMLEGARGQADTEPRLLAILGGLYLETGRAAEALEVLAPLTEAADTNPAVLYNAGRAAAAVGELDRATGFLERSLVALPTSPAARELGFLRLAQGEVTEAYLVLRPWSRLHPEDSSSRFAAVSCAVALGRASEAEEMLAGLPSDDPRTQILWGKTLLLKGDGWGALAIVRPLAE